MINTDSHSQKLSPNFHVIGREEYNLKCLITLLFNLQSWDFMRLKTYNLFIWCYLDNLHFTIYEVFVLFTKGHSKIKSFGI